ncbi:hypothetical protein GALL_439720 [mine drainage metagenome]|uniref:Uncharacterized protein n=1 Tax=mine drainage metagenome TaxID=410659 RepID=A0A1J5Q3B3_9ZZZZ
MVIDVDSFASRCRALAGRPHAVRIQPGATDHTHSRAVLIRCRRFDLAKCWRGLNQRKGPGLHRPAVAVHNQDFQRFGAHRILHVSLQCRGHGQRTGNAGAAAADDAGTKHSPGILGLQQKPLQIAADHGHRHRQSRVVRRIHLANRRNTSPRPGRQRASISNRSRRKCPCRATGPANKYRPAG